jgi:hypothetical protein
MDHKRKLKIIKFAASTWQKGKEHYELLQKKQAMKGKLQVGLDQMGVLHGELQEHVIKQMEVLYPTRVLFLSNGKYIELSFCLLISINNIVFILF